MKKLIFLLLIVSSLSVQAQYNPVGAWEGQVGPSKEKQLTLVFHIKKDDDGGYSGTMDSPQQGALDLKCSYVVVKGDTVSLGLSNYNVKYKGILQSDSTMSGFFMQGGALPLKLKKKANFTTLYRPQTPVPPFNYTSEDVIYTNKDKSIKYGATITIPKGKGPFPAVLLITGSGQQNRDEELFGHKPFAVIADYLTNKGYVVLRVDDRGMGESTGDVINATSADFAQDVMTSFDYLKARKETNKMKLGLLGHSEGGMIAEMVAAQRKDVNFIVLMAAPGIKVTDLMALQNEALMKSMNMDSNAINKYLVLYRKMETSTLAAKDTNQLKQSITADVNEWRATTDSNTVATVTMIHDDESAKKYISVILRQLGTPWMRYFLAYDPKPYLEKISCKVLAIDGSKDVQVNAAANLEGIRKGLAHSKTKKYAIKELPDLNHLFQTCKTCTVGEYMQLEETIAPVALQAIGDWMDNNVKK